MILRKFCVDDYEQVVDMFYDFSKDVYSNRKIGAKYFYYRAVSQWINDKKDIVVVEDKGKLVGFTLAYIDDLRGLTEPVYQGDICYVKEEYRKTRAAYMLYKNVYNYGKEQGMIVSSNGRISNGIDKMVLKHFKAEAKFTTIEG